MLQVVVWRSPVAEGDRTRDEGQQVLEEGRPRSECILDGDGACDEGSEE
jgi:hypothetical protein